ncbi:MAG: helix-turn-helix domain-containing protein [Nitrospirae bacterium]|nr:helix-turn-helix domain-containing protein [Nitrospirota bacterium]
MAKLRLSPRNIVYHGNQKYEVSKQLDLKSVLVKDLGTGKLEVVSIGQLRAQPEDSPQQAQGPERKPDFVSEEHWEISGKRVEIIKPLLWHARTKKEVVARAREFGLNETTLYDWIGKFETLGKRSSLVPGFTDRGGKGKSRLDPAVEAIVESTIKEMIEKGQRTTRARVMRNVEKKCKNAGLEPPHKNTLRRRLQGQSRRKVNEIMDGQKEGRPIRGKHEILVPLDEIQVDETPLDVMIVDEKYRLPIGRGYGTFATDVGPRVVYGFCLHLEHPSFFTFGQCMAMGILPKEAYLRQLGVEGEWPVWGLPKGVVIHTDNAKWFRGKDLKMFAEEHSVSVTFRIKKVPESGGHVERLIRTINDKLHELPGSTFSNPQKKGKYDSERLAILTLKELERWVADWIVNIYHRDEHSSLDGMSPMQSWESGILGSDTAPGIGLPDVIQGDEAEFLRISLLPTVERTIQRGNVIINRIPYFHEVLIALSDKGGPGKKRMYRFKRDNRDISFLYYVDDEHKTYFKIPYRNPGWPPMSIWELKKVRRFLREKNISGQDPEKIFEAYERLQEIEDGAAEKTKAARRAQEMKKRHGEQLKQEATHKKDAGRDGRSSRLRDIFANAKPNRNIRVICNSNAEEGEEQ